MQLLAWPDPQDSDVTLSNPVLNVSGFSINFIQKKAVGVFAIYRSQEAFNAGKLPADEKAFVIEVDKEEKPINNDFTIPSFDAFMDAVGEHLRPHMDFIYLSLSKEKSAIAAEPFEPNTLGLYGKIDDPNDIGKIRAYWRIVQIDLDFRAKEGQIQIAAFRSEQAFAQSKPSLYVATSPIPSAQRAPRAPITFEKLDEISPIHRVSHFFVECAWKHPDIAHLVKKDNDHVG